ncbi:CHRD domain-containing protein [Planctomonas psychrotolerans]|uniref:CHRD domain-containing protein n=1 Tax=Planctomonas psychrotolerans TaxID=2528712 RepID=UPI00123C45D0|nr:CHRD domain-containing protein [Planctomonas psychrotolerans]
MKKTPFLIIPALALGAAVLTASPALAATDDKSYQATLDAINGSNASGTAMFTVSGDQITVKQQVSGLAATFNDAPYPHVQHIHIDAMGVCPTPDADTNGDGVISTTEGGPSYGGIGTTLSTSGDTSPAAGTDLTLAGMGSDYTYERTFTLNPETAAALDAGTAVVVVHGLDPATLSQAAQDAPSDLVPSLPLAATSPALCGEVEVSQMDMPVGGAQTGGGGSATNTDAGMYALGGGLVLAAGATVLARRRVLAGR